MISIPQKPAFVVFESKDQHNACAFKSKIVLPKQLIMKYSSFALDNNPTMREFELSSVSCWIFNVVDLLYINI